ncbi:UDP-N-acetylmuramoylalanyl-D-glutamate--2,6-diaminopimelate ligase [Pilibacter termitis]|uniref:UDP-N-acetylmuramoyl-L-alanyl-D-glutamate--L-lysine ligase n=1 Tax=Pilibacter termitis TaxID=263852 RepID=A0A1T4LZZ2_9ENTE|nr:UDP-N-acetylmuramoyl-L-alanyl-D-glutamate--L-lysine ligase [Pilibacter termitis]SJZ60320.1 UDP-N-acetylmuramoylalanyl-D-glutamate--2,6-diaminopimelate ligase [Pilibacter termitis]
MRLNFNRVREILVKDNLFREMIVEGKWFYETPETVAKREFYNLSYDSRQTDKDTLFFVKGMNFKEEFLKKAVEENGLEFYVSEVVYDVEATAIIVSDVKKAMSLLAQAFYDFPQNDLKIIAFTGTKGKTTSAYFAKAILDETTKCKTALLSTMNTTLDGVTFFKSQLTTPESLDLFRMMNEARENGMTHLIMEVSSQAYKTSRVYGLLFDVGIFLNISPDHIGPIEHPSFEDYFYCKRQILSHSKAIVLNREADYFELLKEEALSQEKQVLIYGTSKEDVDVFVQTNKEKVFSFTLENGERSNFSELNGEYSLRLSGDFNKGNALAASLASLLVGASKEEIKTGVAQTTVPGRMETLELANGATVYVDYAHNKISLSSLLSEVRKQHTGKMIVVLGSPGNKGESRRSDFGEVLSEQADIVILTADDPNYENPKTIAKEIQLAMKHPRETHVEIDRERAIALAISLAENPEDAVVLAGKGADLYQIVEGKRVEYLGDFEVARRMSEG